MIALLEAKIHDPWFLFSIVGQAFFTMRFLVQWVHSERSGRSVVPDAFWTFSIGGGAMLLIYCVHQAEAALAVGQASGLLIYLRNYWLIRRNRARAISGQAAEARRLSEEIARDIGKLADVHDRPQELDEKLARLNLLLAPAEIGASL
jgi:lipid-A-disaccharide synthase-like uncharacterized protein